ncbi:hypothetical protein GCM10027341_52480 [Spirosoma knui]
MRALFSRIDEESGQFTATSLEFVLASRTLAIGNGTYQLGNVPGIRQSGSDSTLAEPVYLVYDDRINRECNKE